jgi:hypothetical protein
LSGGWQFHNGQLRRMMPVRVRAQVAKARIKPGDPIADAIAPGMKRAYTRSIKGALTDAEIQSLAQAIRSRRIASISEVIPAYDPTSPKADLWSGMAESFDDLYAEILRRAGKRALVAADIRGAFTIDNPYTSRWLDERTGNLITNIAESARENIKGMVTRAWTDGIPPDQLADIIRPTIGLTEAQGRAVENRYRSAVEDDVPEAKAASQAAAYADDLLSQRAETIARTETMAASNAGAHDAWADARDNGLLPDGCLREWVASSEDNGACEPCADMDGDTAPLDGEFESADGPIDGPPLHPRCRCTTRLLIPGVNLTTENEAYSPSED